MDQITLSNFLAVMGVNITAAVLCTREAFKIFKAQEPQGGRKVYGPALLHPQFILGLTGSLTTEAFQRIHLGLRALHMQYQSMQ